MTLEKPRSLCEYELEGNNSTIINIKCQSCSSTIRFRVFTGIEHTTMIIYPHKCIDNEELK